MITQNIKNIFLSEGLSEVGFCLFDSVSDKLLNCRAKQMLPLNSKTIILCLFPYKVHETPPLNISRYAAVPDYHKICSLYLNRISQKLSNQYNNYKFIPFIDNSPIPEVFAASTAGIGVKGENGLLINKKYGSWCFIGEIVTDMEIECENHFKKCFMCGNCKKACPSGLHKDKCLSAVSQQKKPLDLKQIELMISNNITWGCDICAEVCPMNKNARNTDIKEFIDGYRNEYSFGENIQNRAYEWRGEAVIKRNSKLFKSI